MKLVKIIRPLFLVALGLHGLALFVPIGPQEAAVIEDVDIAELDGRLSEDPVDPFARTLPVPNPNVASVPNATGKLTAKPVTPAVTAAPAAAARRSAASVTVRPAAPAPRRPAAAGASRVAVATTPSAPAQSVSPIGSANPTSSPENTPTNTTVEVPDDSSETSFLSTVDLPGNSAEDSTNGAGASSNSGTASGAESGDVTVAMLLAEVTQKLPEALRETVTALEKSLTYSAENTDDTSAQKNRADWKTKIQRQANVGSIELIEPTESAALTQVNYPIESSQQTSEFMRGRDLNLCLGTPKPGKAEIGVLFDARGNVVDQPELIRSTGYGAVDEEIKAIAATQNHFPRDRNSKAYSFEVEVNYSEENCVELSDLK